MSGQALRVGMIGCGTVGGGVAQLLQDHADMYQRRAGRPIELARVLVRNRQKAIDSGAMPADRVTDDADAFFGERYDVVVEVAGGVEQAGRFIRRAIDAGSHVVTANKALLAAQGPDLFAAARKRGVCIAFEASCAGGIPCITALQFGLMSNRVTGLYGILNGTCNYILTEMTRGGRPYADALGDAQAKGYAEADPTLDVSGKDAAQKLGILASLAFGVAVEGDALPCFGIDGLDLQDIRSGAELGYDVKLLAIAEQDDDGRVSAAVEPCFVRQDELIAQVLGPMNALSVVGDAVGHTMQYGPGAGRGPTASAVVSDLLNVAAGWYPSAFATMGLTVDLARPATMVPWAERLGRFYLRLGALDKPGVAAAITKILGDQGISISAVLQHEQNVGQFVPLVVTTHEARQGDIDAAVAKLEASSVIDGRVVKLRIATLDG